MNDEIKEILDKLSNRKHKPLINGLRDCQIKNIEHPFITKEEYIDKILNYITNLQQENERLKFYLNDVVFDDNNIDVELSARYLRKLGYIDFDEERQVYVNKHNNQPFMQEDTKEKSFYIKDDELNDYTKQLENKIEKAIEYVEEQYKWIEKSNKRWQPVLDNKKILNILNGKER